MTQEDKQLLLTELCRRLPYKPKGVFLHKLYDPEEVEIIGYSGKWVEVYRKGDLDEVPLELVRPYLRQMSSMTDEELAEWEFEMDMEINGYYIPSYPALDWLEAHHFDYRGLIEKGLALEAPEGMFKTDIENNK